MEAADVLAYIAAATLVAWGAAHIVPTRSVAASFGPISLDNRRVLIMEWVAEGVSHIFVGVLIILITVLEGSSASGSKLVYCVCAAVLVVFAGWTAVTGARTSVIWFRICPVVLTSAAVLLLAATLI